MILICIVFFITLLSSNQDKILQASVLFRHGAREQVYRNQNWTQYQKISGLLTPVGIRQQYVLGQWLRKRYIKDLNLIQNTSDVYVRSTEVNRTFQSAQSALLGLFNLGTSALTGSLTNYSLPPLPDCEHPTHTNESDVLDSRVHPVNIEVVPIKDDRLLRSFNNKMCQTMDKHNQLNRNSSLYQQVEDYVKKIVQNYKLETSTDQDMDFWTLHELQDTLKAYQYKDIPLPQGLSSDTWKKMQQASVLAFSLIHFQTWNQIQLLSTPFFQEIIQSMNKILTSEVTPKFNIYSAHDTTIMLFLHFLNITGGECLMNQLLELGEPQCQILEYPGFSASLIFELWEKEDGQIYVQVLYNGTAMKICSKNQTKCPYNEFQDILSQQFGDFDEYCGIPAQSIKSDESNFIYLVFIVMIVSFLSLIYLLKRNGQIPGGINKKNI